MQLYTQRMIGRLTVHNVTVGLEKTTFHNISLER